MQFPKLNYNKCYEDFKLPQMVKVRQKFQSADLPNPPEHLAKELDNLPESVKVGVKGKTIAITAGSRGKPYYKELMKVMCDKLKEWGAEPFVFPSMGSHAGATAEGQLQHIAQFGITEEYLGVPIKSSMEVVTVATLDDGFPIYCDKYAYEADGVVLFNKIKPHTNFKYKHESGLLKMLCIGVGKHEGANLFHEYGFDNFGPNMERVAEVFLQKVNFVFAVGMVQSASDEIAMLEAIPPEKIVQRDAELQLIAKDEMARFKMAKIDALVIDELGKEISGAGADPNVTGRTVPDSQVPGFKALCPEITNVVYLDLTDATHGNATGVGMADVISYRLVNKIDFAYTYTNSITAKAFPFARMPIYANCDRDAISLAVAHSFIDDLSQAKIVRIKNTLHLEEIECSVAYLDEIAARDDMEVISEPYDWNFNEDGDLW